MISWFKKTYKAIINCGLGGRALVVLSCASLIAEKYLKKPAILSLILIMTLASSHEASSQQSTKFNSGSGSKMQVSDGSLSDVSIFPIKYSLSETVYRTFDYFSKLNNQLSVNLSKDLRGYNLGLMVSFLGRLDSRYDAYPDAYGPGNLGLVIKTPKYWELYNFSIGFNGALTLPTSKASRNSFLNAALSLGVSASRELAYGIGLGLSSTVLLSSHKYEQSNRMGTGWNAPLGFNQSIGLSKSYFNSKLSSSLSYSAYHRIDYQNNLSLFNTLSASVAYNILKKLSVAVGGTWRDQTNSNDSFLDDDKTRVSVSLSYTDSIGGS